MEYYAVLANTSRSQAYIQTLIKNRIIPKKILILNDNNKKSLGKNPLSSDNSSKKIYYFNRAIIKPNESLTQTLIKNKIEFEVIDNPNINSEEIFAILSKIKTKIILVSVYSGQILKEKILSTKKRFLHIHGGKLPYFRGSTTMYYSILKNNKVGASAIFLNKGIDTGKIIIAKDYSITYPLELLDLIFDPLIRADVLISAMRKIKSKKYLLKKQNINSGEDYYVIHPVLKHLSILKGKKC